jgi:hypothetical protein
MVFRFTDQIMLTVLIMNGLRWSIVRCLHIASFAATAQIFIRVVRVLHVANKIIVAHLLRT